MLTAATISAYDHAVNNIGQRTKFTIATASARTRTATVVIRPLLPRSGTDHGLSQPSGREGRFLGVTLLVLCMATFLHAAPQRPNIVFLLVDDLRWNALGCMGDKLVQTPNIDKLATKGVLFRNAFVTTSICWSSRATIFSGQWMRRHHVGDGPQRNLSEPTWKETYPAVLRANGYRTGFIGKFGVGNAKEIAAHEGEFDYWKGLPGQGGRFFIEKDDPAHIHMTEKMGNWALEFLGGSDASKPFCLSVSFNAVHARDHEPREYEPDRRDEMLYEETTHSTAQARDGRGIQAPARFRAEVGRSHTLGVAF